MIRFFGRAKWIGLLSVVLLAQGAAPSVRVDSPAPRRPTAILAAMGVEAELIKERMSDKNTQTFLGIRFTAGYLEGRRVVLALSLIHI